MADKNIEDFYPLSPMQQGMLFHSLLEPESGVYVEQMAVVLRGELKVSAFVKAWQRVLDRYPILRTAFIYDGVKEPVQVVHRKLELPVVELDWSHISQAEQALLLSNYLNEDRTRGFKLTEAPLMRISIIRIDKNAFHFVWTHHHILLDGWSVPVLLGEVFAYYEAFSQGREIVLENPPRFRDYIVWLRKQSMLEAETYWREKLKGFIAPTPLVVDRTGEYIQELPPGDNRYQEAELWLSKETTEALKKIGRSSQVTLNVIVQAVWSLLLSRYCGEDDVCFGVTVSGRPPDLPQAETMIGLFINTLPLRITLPPDSTVVDFLRTLQTDQVEMRQYEYSPLVQVHGWSEVPRDQPLFQSLLVFENYPIASVMEGSSGSITIDGLKSVEQTNYPLNLIAGVSDQLMLKLFYDVTVFDPQTITRMLGHLQAIIESILTNPNNRIEDINILTKDEVRQILYDWNNTEYEFPLDTPVFRLFERYVDKQPDSPAIVFNGNSLTYGELEQRSNQLANHLMRLGVGPDVMVGLFLHRGFNLIISILGIWKAGGAYIPIDPEYPLERIQYMLDDSSKASPGLKIIITEENTTGRLPETSIFCLNLSQDADYLRTPILTRPNSNVTADNLAYVIYTSGSTGNPKGTMLCHKGLTNFALNQSRILCSHYGTRYLQFSSISFDASLAEITTTLVSGGCLVLVDQATQMSVVDLHVLLREQEVTHAVLPPTILRLLPTEDLPHLTTIISAGESCTVDIARRWSKDRNLWNGYGPTEATIGPLFYAIEKIADSDTTIPIGRPIDNIKVFLLDSSMRLVPVGVPGEIHIGGVGLAKGYLNRPDLTKEKFVPNPYLPGEKTYKTGDLGRYRIDGNIEFLGRVDDQVKLRGFRIELGEIENLLEKYASIQQAVVIVHEDKGGEKRLVAFLKLAVLPQGLETATDVYYTNIPELPQIRQYLRSNIPEYMVPAVFLGVYDFPLLPNGKVNRKLLAREITELHKVTDAGDHFIPPRTPEEVLLADIWKNILGVERVGVFDSFFDLGGHSLLATQVTSRIRDVFKVDVSLRSVFESSTLESQAELVRAAQAASHGLAAPAILPANRDKALPLSFAQQRLWFLDQLDPGTVNYNLPASVKVTGTLDVSALRKSITTIIQRHEILRTTFTSKEGQAVQEITSELEFNIPEDDLRNLPVSERQNRAEKIARFEARQPFNLEVGPLIRIRLVHIDEEEWYVLLNMHHIISDGWSINLFMREMMVLYGSEVSGLSQDLPELQIQYVDFSVWQRDWMTGEVLEKQIAFWREQLNDSTGFLALPTDFPRPPVQTFNGDTSSFKISSDLSSQVKDLSRKEAVTIFMFFLTAFQTLLMRYSGQEDVNIGTPIANRNRAEIENLIGFFVNTLVMRTDLSNNPSFRNLLKRVREYTLNAYSYQDLPFEMLVDEIQPQRDLSHTPLFQVMFVMQNAEKYQVGGNFGDIKIQPLDIDAKVAKFDLTLTIIDDLDAFSGVFEFNTDLFKKDTIHRMEKHFICLLESILKNPDQPVTQLDYLTDAEKKQFLDWNRTEQVYEEDLCIHELFTRQAKLTPDAIAVNFEGNCLTYQELDRHSSILANFLINRGVKSDQLVGIYLERSVETVIGILAILKAGGAYLPLDPNYPNNRIEYMLADSQKWQGIAPIILTHSLLSNQLPEDIERVILIDLEWDVIFGVQAPDLIQDESPASSVTPDNLAYVIYTSGSTGKPKGVALEHRGLRNLVEAQTRGFYINSTDRVLQFASLSFDASVSEIFMALVTGATLYLARQETLTSAPDLLELMSREAITAITLPPSLLKVLPEENLPGLRTIISAGESCSIDIAQRWSKGRNLINAYGPTEATIGPTFYPVKVIPDGINSIPIGKPISNMYIFLLDKNLQQIPVGAIGEIYIGGVGLAREYLNQPELTSEKFVQNPFRPEERIYRTGDAGRWLPSGDLEFMGRLDQQVKIRGFRIELEEIEMVLTQFPEVNQAVVLAREDFPGVKRLVGYVILNTHSYIDEVQTDFVQSIRKYLAERLPDYMVPASIILMTEFPLTPNGKIDRKALPMPEAGNRAEAIDYIAPRTEEEKILAEIWGQILGYEEIGVEDNFFNLGGDSILSIQMVAKANSAGLSITPRHVFQNPTIAGLVLLSGRGVVKAEQGMVSGELPLTPIQHWFFSHHTQFPNHWNTSMMLAVFQEMEVEHLEKTIRFLLTYHDALRIRYEFSGNGWRQFNTPFDDADELPFHQYDIADVDYDERQSAIGNIANELQTTLDLRNGPLMRIAYIKLGLEEPSRLLFIFHHLVFDGISWRILVHDFQSIYSALLHGEEPNLPPKTTSFKEWATNLEKYAQTEEVLGDWDYWKKQIEYETHIPVDFTGGRNNYGDSKVISTSLDEQETDVLLKNIPSLYGTHVNDVLISMLARAMRNWTNQNHLLIEMEGHGREPIDIELDVSRTIGWFTSAFPVRVQLEENSTILDDLKQTHQQLSSVPARGFTFGLLRYLSKTPGVKERMIDFHEAEINFNYLGQFDQVDFNQDDDWISAMPAFESPGKEQSPDNPRSAKLYIIGSVTGGVLSIYWSYSSRLHKESTIEMLAEMYVQELRKLINVAQTQKGDG